MSGRLFFDRNGNSAYDAGVDQYVSNQTFLLTRQASARRLEERARVEIVRTTTGFNGEYSFSVFATLRPNEPVYLNFVNLPNVREFTFFADGSGMLPKLGPLNFATTTTTAAFVSPKPRTSTSTTKTTFTSTSKSRTSTGFPVPTYLPVGLIGSTANDVNKGSNLVIDPSGDVYVAGLYSGDLTIGTTNLTHRGSGDGLIVKLNGTTGQVIWTVNFGNSSADHVDAIMLSRDGQVLLAMGPYNGTIQIGPFVTGDYDWWMAGLNPVNGAVIWLVDIITAIKSNLL